MKPKYDGQNVFWQIGLRYGCCLFYERNGGDRKCMEWASWAVRSLIRDVIRFSHPSRTARLAIGRGIKAGLEAIK